MVLLMKRGRLPTLINVSVSVNSMVAAIVDCRVLEKSQ